MRTVVRALVPGLVLAGCVPSLEEHAAPIIGGSPSADDDAVVLLVSWPIDESVVNLCSAVLIAPTVLLTAAHCVDPATHPAHIFRVFFGADATAFATPAQLVPVTEAVASVIPHPSYDPAPPFLADIGVIRLAAPAAVTPLALPLAPYGAELVGNAAEIIGYGQTVYGTPNRQRYAATTTVAALGPTDTVVVGDAVRRTCVGDSGGPAIVTIDGVPTVVGVNSYSETTGCTEPAHFRRTDVYDPFIRSFLPSGGGADAGPEVDAGEPAAEAGGGCNSAPGSTFPLFGLGLLALLRLRQRR